MKKIVCEVCKHEWYPRVPNPKVCPRCKNYLNRKTRRKQNEPIPKD